VLRKGSTFDVSEQSRLGCLPSSKKRQWLLVRPPAAVPGTSMQGEFIDLWLI
jgi:hypothetical protein